MAKIEDCPGFETFGSDVKAAREALNISRRALAEQVSIDPRYLANIELEQTVPSVPVVLQLIRICKLPVERYLPQRKPRKLPIVSVIRYLFVRLTYLADRV